MKTSARTSARGTSARAAAAALLALAIAPLALGCAHRTTTVTTTTTRECPGDPADDEVAPRDACEVVEETVETTEPGRCHGLVSCTFVVVGEVIALPFRIVGAAVDVVL